MFRPISFLSEEVRLLDLLANYVDIGIIETAFRFFNDDSNSASELNAQYTIAMIFFILFINKRHQNSGVLHGKCITRYSQHIHLSPVFGVRLCMMTETSKQYRILKSVLQTELHQK